MKTLITLLLFVLVLVGCSKSPMMYDQAKERFAVGMTPAQIRQALGDPTDVSEEASGIYWNYVPEREIQKGPKGSYSAFTVVFKQGKAAELLKHDIVKH